MDAPSAARTAAADALAAALLEEEPVTRADKLARILVAHSADARVLDAVMTALASVRGVALPPGVRTMLIAASLLALRHHAASPHVLSKVCNSMLLLAVVGQAEPPPTTRRALENGSLVDALVGAARRHADDAPLHDAVSHVLSAALVGQSPDLCARVAAGALDVIARGVLRHGGLLGGPGYPDGDTASAYHGLHALSALLCDAPRNAHARMLAQGIAQGVVRAMRVRMPDFRQVLLQPILAICQTQVGGRAGSTIKAAQHFRTLIVDRIQQAQENLLRFSSGGLLQ
jgi:hypothetical protein